MTGELRTNDVTEQVVYFRASRQHPARLEEAAERAVAAAVATARRVPDLDSLALLNAAVWQFLVDREGWQAEVVEAWLAGVLGEALSVVHPDYQPRARHLRAVPGDGS